MDYKGLYMYKINGFTKKIQGHTILFVLLLTLFSVSSYGQKILSVKDLSNSTTVLKTSGIDVDRLNSLMQDIQPAAYFKNGKSNYYGLVSPVVLFVDYAQLSNISTQINKLARIEMVKIYLRGNNPEMVSQELLNQLPSLKYIFFVCDACGESNMTNILFSRRDLSENILVIHNSEINN